MTSATTSRGVEVVPYSPELVRDWLSKLTPQRPVLNSDEAARFVGCKNERAFRRWRKRWQVRPCGHGRYSTRALTAAMEREARG